VKRVGQICSSLAPTKDLAERTYQSLVRIRLCSTSMRLADDYIERNITSSDVEFLLEGSDVEKKHTNTRKIKTNLKPQSASMTTDLSGLKDCDVDMNDIMLVPEQMTDKGLTLCVFISHSPADSANLNNPLAQFVTGVKRKDIDHSQSKYVG
jgi:hypothetical protein